MARRHIGTSWDRKARNDINDNFIELYGDVGGIVDKITGEVYEEIKSGVRLQWKEPVATIADLPKIAEIGDTVMVMEQENGMNYVYRFNGEQWVKIQGFNDTSISEIYNTLSAEIDKKETPAGAQAKADQALNESKSYATSLVSDIITDDNFVKVVEQGTSTNGEYIRYSNGLQICWARPFDQVTNIKTGNIWRSDVAEWVFPKPFARMPISISVISPAYGRWCDVGSPYTLSSVGLLQYSAIESANSYTTAASAIGWWK